PLEVDCPTYLGCPALSRSRFQPIEAHVARAHMPQPVPRHELLGFRERPVDHRALPAVETNALALRAGVEAASLEHHPRLNQLLVEFLVLRHSVGRWGSRRLTLLAFLSHYQHTHPGLLQLHFRVVRAQAACGLAPSSNGRRPSRPSTAGDATPHEEVPEAELRS